jgi:hypothetical protein
MMPMSAMVIKRPTVEGDGIMGRLPWFQERLLPPHVGCNKRYGSQMKGAEDHADHAPDKTAHSGDGRAGRNPFIDGQKKRFQHRMPPNVDKRPHITLFIE